MGEKKIQWHPAFCSAVRLELKDNRGDLIYIDEYNINRKPIRADMLIIKKNNDIVIHNDIGRIFKGHNILEYKGPGDIMDVNTYYKVLAYACLYKSSGGNDSNGYVGEDDITVSLIREEKPYELLKWFKTHKYVVEKYIQGIYYIKKYGIFDTQVIVISELDRELYKWITKLTRSIDNNKAKELIYEIDKLNNTEDRLNADALLDVAMGANPKEFGRIKEEDGMCNALLELMRPEYEEAKRRACEEGHAQGMAQGMAQGQQYKLISLICCKLRKNKTIEQIADELEENISNIENICAVAYEYAPDYNEKEIAGRVLCS